VEEVAKELVGLFLICKESNVVMCIVEMEAYEEGEEIYRNKFLEPPLDFRSPTRVLISYKIRFGQQLMFITTRDDDFGDLVHLQICNVVHGE